ncbi:hypothetical protein WAE58_03480 [Pedobacter panaciterrae]|uniref:Glycosyl hydrolase n=1 Tax=Pedobacter panaciterrae TaxID=363849 RepID=A0ABU8NGU1_9SPHI|nr:hypothetical protein [uncultured Pedobacter sp.]
MSKQKTNSGLLLKLTIGFVGIALFVSLTGVKTPSTQNPIIAQTAVKSVDFLNSIGVNSAISKRGESLDKTIELMKYTGIRWIRAGYEGDIPEADFIKLHKETGVRFSYGLLSGGTDIKRLLAGARKLDAVGALLAFEGSNEPNNWGFKYKGAEGGKNLTWLPVAQLQKDLYDAVKSDKTLKKYPVWDLCENGAQTDNVGLQFLKIPKGAGTSMPDGTKYADFATCHNYFSHPSHPGLYDNQTWNAADPGPLCKVDGLYGNYGKTWRGKHKGYTENELLTLPRVTTETGGTLTDEITEEKQARLYLNLYLSQFKRNWRYTAVYLLRDRVDEAGNQTFGFYKPDYSPRKSAIYLHNLTTILADKPLKFSLGKLAFQIIGQPETVHTLLLQKSNGRFELVIWGEKAKGTEEIEIKLSKAYPLVKVYDPTKGTEAVQVLRNIKSVKLKTSDHPFVIEI